MAVENIGSIVYEARIDTSSMRADAAKAENTARSLGESLKENIGGAVNRVAESAAYLTKRLLVVGGAVALLGKSLVGSAADLQKTNASFQVLIGNTEVANRLFSNIKKFADTTPFEFPELAKATTTMLGYGVTADKVLDRLKRLGDAAAAAGGDLNGITLAYSQMVGRGKVTGDNLRQLTENMVTLRSELSKVSGVPIKDLDKAIENSEISVDELNAALDLATNTGGRFFGGTDKLAQTFNGRMSTLKDTVKEFGRNLIGVRVDPQLGLVVEPGGIFDRLSKGLEKLAVFFKENSDKIIATFKTAFDFILNNGTPIAIFVGTILTAAFAAWAVSVVAATWPILAIAAAVTGLYLLYQRFKPQVDAVIAVFKLFWETIRPIREFIVNQLLTAWRDLSAAFEQIRIALAPFMPQLIMLAKIIGVALLIPLAAAVAGVIALITIFSVLIRVFASVVRAIVSVQEVLFSLWQTVIGTVAGIHKWFFNAGRDLIMGFVNGIKSAIGTVKDTLVGLTKKLTDWKGPLTLDKMILQKSGQAVMQGFVKGLESQYSSVQSSLSGLTKSLSTDVNTNFTSSGMRSIGSISNDSTPSNAPVNVELNMSGIMTRSRSDLRDVAKDMIRATNEELTAKGLQPIGDGAI